MFSTPFEKYRDIFIDAYGLENGCEIFEAGEGIESREERTKWYEDLLNAAATEDYSCFDDTGLYHFLPVSVEEFVCGEAYLNKEGILYPEVLKALIDLNSGQYAEAIICGGIGSGKTTLAHYATAYTLYVLSCLKNPHALFKLDPASEIAIIFQSLNATVAKHVEYQRFRALIEQSYYFTKVFAFDRTVESRMLFPNRIEVYSVSGSEAAAIGQNILGGVLDESLVWNTFLLTFNNTTVKIEDIQVGDRVLAEGGVFDKVIAVKCKGLKPCYRVTYKSGHVLEGAEKHPVKTQRGWVFIKDLLKIDGGYYASTKRPESVQIVDRKNVQSQKRQKAGVGVSVGNFSPVDSITYIGHHETWDIETEKTHTYYANGVLVHNCNYMAVVEKSKSNVDGGTFDQAWALYNSIVRRRKTRFMKQGKMFGMLCLVSSKRYPGQFTDIKEQERAEQIRKTGKTDIYLYDKRVWEVKPEGTYNKNSFFPVFMGDDFRQPMVLKESEVSRFAEEDISKRIMMIPQEYKQDFERDITNALREIAGFSTLALHPYLVNTDAVSKGFQDILSVVSETSVILGVEKLKFFKKNIVNPNALRFAHIDLSKNLDSTGIVIGHVVDFVILERGADQQEVLPNIRIDMSLQIKPPRYGEIDYSQVRNILYVLRSMGLPIKWVTFDSYNSVDSMQILRGKGFITGLRSMDTSVIPYTFLKSALYDGRLVMPKNDILFVELKSLEYDSQKGKVDHPSNATKDVSDSLAGVVYGLVTRRETWVAHKVASVDIPESVRRALSSDSLGTDNSKR